MVSVILPNYNHARFLPLRIDSILGQTFRDFELIILDDCSTDNSLQIIRGYASGDDRIRVVTNDTNSGNPFRQWQKGITLARGEWVWIAESDDFADSTLLERLMSVLSKNENAGIAYCQSNFADHENNVIGNHLKNLSVLDSELWKTDFCLPGHVLLSKHMIILNIIPNASAVVFKKSLTDRVDWNEIISYKLSGDRLFWSILLSQGDLCFVADSLNYFRMGDSTVRSKHDTTPEYLNERLKILLRLERMVTISPDDKVKCMKNFKEHLRKIRKKNQGRISAGIYWSIFRSLLKFDPSRAIGHFIYLLGK